MPLTWSASWNNQLSRRYTVQNAFDRIQRMLTRAHVSVRAVSRDTDARSTYVTHFNNASLSNLPQVTNVIRLMHERVTGGAITMHYVPDQATYDALGYGPLPAGVTIPNVEAFVVQLGVAPGTALWVFIAPSFFTGNVYMPNAINQRTGTGTLLHELSHGVANTDDHAYTWENSYRSISANQRANNADSYRAYCQSFDQ